jgi:hypothetical protein
MTFVSRPKTLAERLAWMAENVPGFREELQEVEAIRQRALARRAGLPARSASEDSQSGAAGEARLGKSIPNRLSVSAGGNYSFEFRRVGENAWYPSAHLARPLNEAISFIERSNADDEAIEYRYVPWDGKS